MKDNEIYFSTNVETELASMNKAIPCPFCGEVDGLYAQDRDFYDKLVEENGSACLVMGCKRCNANVTIYSREDDDSYDAMLEAAINRWNTRRLRYEYKKD